MLDSYVTVVGTVLNTPERRLTKNNSVVTHFRVASHPRRYDRESQDWVDAPNLRIRVNCWRRLAENVCGSVFSGDPVIVYGRISTRDWTTDQGEQRVAYEIEAVSVGPDLNRGTSTFTRQRAESAGLVVEDGYGEPGEDPASARSGSTRSGQDDLSEIDPDGFALTDSTSTVDDTSAVAVGTEPGDEEESGDEDTGEADETADAGSRGRKRGRQPVAV